MFGGIDFDLSHYLLPEERLRDCLAMSFRGADCVKTLRSPSTLRGASGQGPSTAFSPESLSRGQGERISNLNLLICLPFVVSPVEP